MKLVSKRETDTINFLSNIKLIKSNVLLTTTVTQEQESLLNDKDQIRINSNNNQYDPAAASATAAAHSCILYCAFNGSPIHLFTLMPSSSSSSSLLEQQQSTRRKKSSRIDIAKQPLITTTESYFYCLTQSAFITIPDSTITAMSPPPPATISTNPPYNPYYLDDPELKTGNKSKTVIILAGYITSIIQYSRPLDLKKEINDYFRDTHPNIDAALTLSQIRALKLRMLALVKAQDVEYSSLAMAFVYMEKLILKSFITKLNRRLMASICLLLAVKVNDPKDKMEHDSIEGIIESMEKIMEIPRRDIYANEFSVYAALEFTLFLPEFEVLPHLERIFSMVGMSFEEYVSKNLYFMPSYA